MKDELKKGTPKDWKCLYRLKSNDGFIDKDNSFETQKRVFREYLKRHTATCTMASEATGIPQKCLTRRKRDLELSGQLIELFIAPCQITGLRAAYLTTNENLIKSLRNGK